VPCFGRGCSWIGFGLQAPGFYQKQGYETFGELEDFPAGHSRLWLRKRLKS
jgi:hypothetical protein